jgi:hypothetical protein
MKSLNLREGVWFPGGVYEVDREVPFVHRLETDLLQETLVRKPTGYGSLKMGMFWSLVVPLIRFVCGMLY